MQNKDEGSLSHLEDHTIINGNYAHVSMIINRQHLTIPVNNTTILNSLNFK